MMLLNMKVWFDSCLCMQARLSIKLLIKGLLCMLHPYLSLVMRVLMHLTIYEVLKD